MSVIKCTHGSRCTFKMLKGMKKCHVGALDDRHWAASYCMYVGYVAYYYLKNLSHIYSTFFFKFASLTDCHITWSAIIYDQRFLDYQTDYWYKSLKTTNTLLIHHKEPLRNQSIRYTMFPTMLEGSVVGMEGVEDDDSLRLVWGIWRICGGDKEEKWIKKDINFRFNCTTDGIVSSKNNFQTISGEGLSRFRLSAEYMSCRWEFISCHLHMHARVF